MKTEPEHHFEQVDGLALMGEERESGLDRWIERTEGAIWGLCGGVCLVLIVAALVVGVVG